MAVTGNRFVTQYTIVVDGEEQLRKLTQSADAAAKESKNLEETLTRTGRASSVSSSENRRAARAFDQVKAAADPAERALQKFNKQQENLRRAQRAGIITHQEFVRWQRLLIAQHQAGAVAANTQAAAMSRLAGLSRVAGGVAVGAGLGSLAGGGALALGAGVAIGAASFVRTSDALTRMERALTVVSGGAQAAAQDLRFLQAVGDTVGVSFLALGENFAKFAAAAERTSLAGETARDIFQSFAEATAVLGVSSGQAQRVFTALTQIISKGRVQAEELRGQLGDVLPGAFQIAAEAMNVTTAELDEMLKKGEVVAEELLPKMAMALEEAFGRPDRLTIGQQFTRVGNALTELIRLMEQAFGPAKALANVFGGLADALQGVNRRIVDLRGMETPITQEGVGTASLEELVGIRGARGVAGTGQLASAQGMARFGVGVEARLTAQNRLLDRIIALESARVRAQGRPQGDMESAPVGEPLGLRADMLAADDMTSHIEAFQANRIKLEREAERERKRIREQDARDEIRLANHVWQEEERLNEEARQKLIEFNQEQKRLQKEADDAAKKALEDRIDDLDKFRDQFSSFQGDVSQTLADVFRNKFEDVGDAWAQLMDRMYGSFANQLADRISQAGFNFLLGASGGTSTGLLGRVLGFAQGGVVNGPTVFPMANGAGLMGEAGPEAIMPLTRTSGGDLGVKASGMSVVVNNYGSSEVNARQETDTNGMARLVLDVVSADVQSGGHVATALRGTTLGGTRRPLRR